MPNTIDAKALIVSSLTFVVGLAWNSAFQDLFKKITWLSDFGPWVYAIFLTMLAIVIVKIVIRIEKVSEREISVVMSATPELPPSTHALKNPSKLLQQKNNV